MMNRIAFQGMNGAYSQEATHQYFGEEIETIPCHAFKDLFTAVETKEADFAILPVENAVAGSVNQSYELLAEYDLSVYAEVILRVRHTLITLPDTNPDDIQIVRSHPQALSQCQNYIRRHGYTAEAHFDTAGSARDLAEKPEPGVAVIASALAAKLYGLKVIDQDIEDFPFNFTRFFLLSYQKPPRAQKNKTSIVFATPHQPGVLYNIIGEFAKRNINLTKLESRPRLNKPWQYLFYLDFEGHSQDPKTEAALMGVLRQASFVKLLGSYQAADTPFDEGTLP
jgi:prephenate dehydratase